MIRKAIIVVLTLAAAGMMLGRIISDPQRLYRWDVSTNWASGVCIRLAL